jgi:hypothetical protein
VSLDLVRGVSPADFYITLGTLLALVVIHNAVGELSTYTTLGTLLALEVPHKAIGDAPLSPHCI